jgi:hypothetical protein
MILQEEEKEYQDICRPYKLLVECSKTKQKGWCDVM